MNNSVKIIVLLSTLSLIFISIGFMFGSSQGAFVTFLFTLLINGIGYFYSDKIALSVSGAIPLTKSQAPQIHAITESLSRKMSLPIPTLYLMSQQQINAFATGRDEHNASIAVTSGLITNLTDDEIEGVIAHELAHIKNKDILIATIAAIIASSISAFSQAFIFSGSNNGDGEDQQQGFISSALSILYIFIAPLGGLLLQMAISRSREFTADETAAKVIGEGHSLANALEKIEMISSEIPMNINPAYSSLYIGNPYGTIGTGLAKLFSTHPPTAERVAKLRQMQNDPFAHATHLKNATTAPIFPNGISSQNVK